MDKPRVVIVDDVLDTAEALAGQLRLDGYDVRIALNGLEALALAEQFRPHCMIIDVYMPAMNGAELTTQMRARYGDDVVLLGVTGGTKTHPVVRDTFARVDHYFHKPVDIQDLRKLLPPVAA